MLRTNELLLGPPGTGKTTALLNIVEEELSRGTPPDRIALVTFTRRGAEEALSRAGEKFGLSRRELPWFRTLHSLCYRVLGVRSDDVLDGAIVREFAVWAGIELSGKFSDDREGYTRGDRIMHMIHVARVAMRPLREVYDEDDDQLPWDEVDRVDRHLRAYKAAARKVDYTDMLEQLAKNSSLAPRLEVVLVDEVQDLAALSHVVAATLGRTARRVVWAGDDDQAIYRWAGASPAPLLESAWSTRVLGKSWRVPVLVQEVANKIVSRITSRREKTWSPRDEQGRVDEVEDISHVEMEEGEVLILARNTYVLSDRVAPELRRRGIYYDWDGRGPVRAEIIRAIQLWETLRAGGKIEVEEVQAIYRYMSPRSVSEGKRALGAVEVGSEPMSIEDLRSRGGLLVDSIWHEAMDRLPRDDADYVLAARRRGERVAGPARVRLSTIHGSKGGEADHVVLMTEFAHRTFQEMERSPEDEARVWYVAVTRARKHLTIVGTRSRFKYDI